VYPLLIDYKKAYDSVRREVLYNIAIGFGRAMNLLRLIKMCLKETHIKFRRSRHWSDIFPMKNGLKKRNALSSLLSNLA
jgi:hypothetical protein